MDLEVGMSEETSWRSPEFAERYKTHDYADFAQEFLRRNPVYQRDHADTKARIADAPDTAKEEQEGLARRWGLCFPLRSRSIADQ
ncbi:hypothetical protein GRI58_15265 [Porphyrobacter algicida]|uniref:Transcriptional regulator-like domain-containing protein n=1 Tax=Qipengyuania algicida TaxID=1836209 RepID=A0A845ATI9_9SPHN|nr:DUF6499 domain-containing protein [Qipengyuania algicida]MXP30168.1 hypothetical protein [Qipengyuania algicida]